MTLTSTTVATHIIIDYWVSTPDLLERTVAIREILHLTAEVAGVNVLGEIFHQFEPSGVTGCLILAQSHLSIHTWPEFNFLTIDLCACGELNSKLILDMLDNHFQPFNRQVRVLSRGSLPVNVLGVTK